MIWIFTSSPLVAQRFEGGIRGGLVASEVSGDNLSGPHKLGWYASAFTFTPISEYTSLKLEIMYIQKGSRSIPSERNQFYEYKFYLQYVEIPVHLRMDISPYTTIDFLEQLNVTAGLSVAVLVDDFESDDGTTTFLPGEKEDYHGVELNLVLGLSYPLSESLDFYFGFSNSLTPIRPHSGRGRLWYNWGQYHTLWTFGLGYIIW